MTVWFHLCSFCISPLVKLTIIPKWVFRSMLTISCDQFGLWCIKWHRSLWNLGSHDYILFRDWVSAIYYDNIIFMLLPRAERTGFQIVERINYQSVNIFSLFFSDLILLNYSSSKWIPSTAWHFNKKFDQGQFICDLNLLRIALGSKILKQMCICR